MSNVVTVTVSGNPVDKFLPFTLTFSSVIADLAVPICFFISSASVKPINTLNFVLIYSTISLSNLSPATFTEFSVTMKTKQGEADDTVFNSLRDGTDQALKGTLAEKNFIANPKITYGSTTADVTMNGDAVKIAKTAFPDYDETDTTTDKTVTLDITITFGWGTYFTVENSVVNPYVFYNGKDYGEDTRKEANTVINAIAKLNTVKYVVIIDGTTNVNGK